MLSQVQNYRKYRTIKLDQTLIGSHKSQSSNSSLVLGFWSRELFGSPSSGADNEELSLFGSVTCLNHMVFIVFYLCSLSNVEQYHSLTKLTMQMLSLFVHASIFSLLVYTLHFLLCPDSCD